MPVTLIFTRPDGVEHSRVTLPDQGLGGRASTLSLAGSAMTGTWRAKVHADPKADPIAQVAFLVEDFVPERLELKLEPAAQALSPEQPGTIKLAGRYLYGPPAAGLAVEGEIVVKPSPRTICRALPATSSASPTSRSAPVRKPLEGLPATDADGKADVAVAAAGAAQDQPAARGRRDPEAARSRAAAPSSAPSRCPSTCKTPRIGIKPLFAGNQVGEGEPARFEAIVLGRRRQGRRGQGPQVGAAAPRPALAVVQPRRLVELRARDQHAPRRHRHGRRRTRRARQDRGQGRLGPLPPRGVQRRHRPRSPASSSMPAGTPTRPPTAPRCSTSRSTSRPTSAGDTARVKIATRMAGRALIAVMGSGLASTQEVDLPAGGGEVPIRVSERLEPRRLRHASCSIGRWTRRPSACRPARSACAGSPSTRRRARSTCSSTRPRRSSPAPC